MTTRNRNDTSTFVAYCRKFRTHLKTHRELLGEFLEFYSYWAPMRRETIETLEKLVETACERQKSVNYTKGAAKLVAVAGNVAFAIGCFFNPVISVSGKALATVGHGVASGISAADANSMARLRKKAKQLLSDDLVERNALVELGLEYNAIIVKIQEVIESFKEVGLSYAVGEICDVTGFHEFVDNLTAIDWRRGIISRDIVATFITFFTRNQEKIDGVAEIATILNKFAAANVESIDAAISFVEFAFDVNTLYTLANGNQGILGSLGTGPVNQVINAFFMYQDCKDLANTFMQISEGSKSVTAEQINDALQLLKKEEKLMKKNYDALISLNAD